MIHILVLKDMAHTCNMIIISNPLIIYLRCVKNSGELFAEPSPQRSQTSLIKIKTNGDICLTMVNLDKIG